MALNLGIAFQPKQQRLWELAEKGTATWLGYGGARGGGKSGAGRRVLLRRRLLHPGTVGMIFRRTYPDLLDNHIEPMWREFPGLQDYYNKGEKVLTLPVGNGKTSQIVFRYAENAKAIDSFLGKEYQDIFVDQAEALTGEELVKLKTSCRWTGDGDTKCNFMLGYNPGGKGSAFLKRIFHERRYLPGENPTDYESIQAYGWDNWEWVKPWLRQQGVSHQQYYHVWDDAQRKECFLEHSDYVKSMWVLSKGLQAGWLYGDFDNFTGQYFHNFEEHRHVVDPAQMTWRPWFKRWVSIDWGYIHNAVAHWFTQAYIGEPGESEPVIWCYRELVRNRTPSERFAEEVCELSHDEEIDAIYIDQGAKSRSDSGDTPYDQMNREFRRNGLPQAGLANKDRVGGWTLLRSLLGETETQPKFVISRACARLIATLPIMANDAVKVEDCEKFDCGEDGEGGDDAADCARYGLMSRLKPNQKPAEQEIAERLAPVQDMTERAMLHRRLVANKTRKPFRMIRRGVRR